MAPRTKKAPSASPTTPTIPTPPTPPTSSPVSPVTAAEIRAAAHLVRRPDSPTLNAHQATLAAIILIAGKCERAGVVPVEIITETLKTSPAILSTGVHPPGRHIITSWHQLSGPHDDEPNTHPIADQIIGQIHQHLLDPQATPFPAIEPLSQAFLDGTV